MSGAAIKQPGLEYRMKDMHPSMRPSRVRFPGAGPYQEDRRFLSVENMRIYI
jgi:hypothetical protein